MGVNVFLSLLQQIVSIKYHPLRDPIWKIENSGEGNMLMGERTKDFKNPEKKRDKQTDREERGQGSEKDRRKQRDRDIKKRVK